MSELTIAPAPTIGIVTRRALLGRLSEAPSPRVISVAAPAGSGKSTLLRQWRDQDPRHARSLAIEESHDDPVTLVADIARALGSGRAGSALARVVPELAVTDPTRGVAKLIRVLDRSPSPLLLLLDDMHRLTGQRSLDALAMFIDRMPDGWQVALAARAEVPLPFARWRSMGWLQEITFADLAMDAEEVEDVLRRSGQTPTAAMVADVLSATEGWAVGVYLTAQALGRGHAIPAASFVRGDHHFISTYLESQVMHDLDAESRDLLVRTSILASVSGPLADVVTGRTGSATRLDRIAHINLLVLPVDDERRWFRYHSLLRDVLIRQLEDTTPDVDQLHLRASRWYEAEGSIDQAIDHAFRARDIDVAARLVAQSVQSEYRLGRVATVRMWLSWFGDDALGAHPGLACLAAIVAALEGEPKEAERNADLAFRAPEADPVEGRPHQAPDRWLVRALLCGDGPAAMLEDADRSIDTHGRSWAWSPTAFLLAGAAEMMLGDEVKAQRRFEDVERGFGAESAVARLPARAERALMAMARRQWSEASEILALDRATMQSDPDAGRLAGMLWLVADARLQLHRGMMPAAHERLTQAQLGRAKLSWAIPWYAVRALIELARTQLRVEDGAGAKASLAQAREILAIRPHLGLVATAVEEVGHMALDLPDRRPARSTLSRAELRLLPLLQTYLSFKEIGIRLGISVNTVKTEAWSIYAKLGATSRSEAVENAEEAGLLERIFDA